MIDGKNFFDQPVRNDKEKLKILEKLLQAKEMIIQLVVYQIIPISKIPYFILEEVKETIFEFLQGTVNVL